MYSRVLLRAYSFVEGEFALKIDKVCGVTVFARKFEEGFHVAQQHVHIVDKYGVAVPHILSTQRLPDG